MWYFLFKKTWENFFKCRKKKNVTYGSNFETELLLDKHLLNILDMIITMPI